MTPPTVAPHSTVFRSLYTAIEKLADLLHIPSWLREVLRGLVFALVVLGAIKLAAHQLALSVFLGGTAVNVLYGLKLDPNDAGKPSELPDAAIAESAVAVVAVALYLLGVH
jgi:hypothetical protein